MSVALAGGCGEVTGAKTEWEGPVTDGEAASDSTGVPLEDTGTIPPEGSTGAADAASETGRGSGDASTDGGQDAGTVGSDDDGSSSSGGPAPIDCNESQMVQFPVATPHNIGYDNASCGTGTCEVSCPDANANSDWNGAAGHHGIDVFAHYRAEIVAVADGVIERVGVVSDTSGLRVRLRDACGWEYYYGHLDEAVVVERQVVTAGELLGYMGSTGAASVHLHFNISFEGDYNNDIDPFGLLDATSPTACGL